MNSWADPLAVRRVLAASLVALLAAAGIARAGPVPPKPARYVTDSAGVLSPAALASLEGKLDVFDRATSNQILVWIAPHVPEGTTPEELGADAIRAWGVGQAGKDNGIVFFVFTKDRKTRIATGYGMEGAVPDALAKRILAETVRPYLARGDFEGGIERGVADLMAAASSEGHVGMAIDEEDPGLPWHLAVAVALALVVSRLRGGGVAELTTVAVLGAFFFFFGANAPVFVSWILLVFYGLVVAPILVWGRLKRGATSSGWSGPSDHSWSSSHSDSSSSSDSSFSGGGGDSGGGGASDSF